MEIWYNTSQYSIHFDMPLFSLAILVHSVMLIPFPCNNLRGNYEICRSGKLEPITA
jgi:hypothetical protein